MNNVRNSIGWCDYTINPVKGYCPNKECPLGKNCYARRGYDRNLNETFKDKKIRYMGEIEKAPMIYWSGFERLRKPSRIFVGSTMELFGDWIQLSWMEDIFEAISHYPQHTFIFLTKKPENLIKWSPFPDNVWVGVSIPRAYDDTIVGHFEAFQRISRLGEVKATVRFISFEPLLESIASEFDFGLDMAFKAYGISWVIIGLQTPYSPKTAPKIEWIKEIIEATDQAGIPVFLKNNLAPVFCDSLNPFPSWAFQDGYFTDDNHPYVDLHLRQEFPEVK